jgi:hypothetical protein
MNGYITCDVDNIDLSHGDKFIITANKRTNKLSGGLVNMPFLDVLILVGIDLHNEYLPMTHILVLIVSKDKTNFRCPHRSFLCTN